MRFRNTLILAVILLAGIVSVKYLNKKDAKKEEFKKSDEKILAIEPGKIKELWLQPGEVHAVRDSLEWRLISPIQTAGDKSTLDAIVNMFDWAKKERIISSDPQDYADFGLQPERSRVVVKQDEKLDTVYVGDKNPTGSFVFARKAGFADVFLTTTSLESNTQKTLFDLRDKSALAFTRDQAVQVELNSAKAQLAFAKEGGQWKITSPRSLPAEDSKINDIVTKVSNQRAASFEDENPADLKKYGLDNPTVVFNVYLGVDRAKKTLLIGKQDGASFYARDESRLPVFKVDSSFVHSLQLTLKDVRAKKPAVFNSTQVSKVVVSHSDSTFVFEKDTSNTWVMKKPFTEKIKTWKVTSLVSDVEMMQAVDFVADDPNSLLPFGLHNPLVRCELYQQDQLLVSVQLGKMKDAENIYVNTSSSATVYAVKKDILDKLKIHLSDFLDTTVTAAPAEIKEEN